MWKAWRGSVFRAFKRMHVGDVCAARKAECMARLGMQRSRHACACVKAMFGL